MSQNGLPPKQGLYDPQFEHDACGVGFIVHMKGKPSHEIVKNGLTILKNLEHRGAVGAEANSGDGAGVLMQVPDAFLRRVGGELGITLPARRNYGVGMIFLPTDAAERTRCEQTIERIVAEEGQTVLGCATYRRTMRRWVRQPVRSSRSSDSSLSVAPANWRMSWHLSASSTSFASARLIRSLV